MNTETATNSSGDAPAASQSSAGMDQPGRAAAPSRHPILTRILAESQPAPLSAGWNFLGSLGDVYRLRESPAAVAERLKLEFALEDLVATRIVLPRPDGSHVLHHAFGDPTNSFAVVDRDGQRLDVQSARGTLTSGVSCLEAATTWQADGDQRPQEYLLLADDDDVTLLNRLGIDCTWAAGLDQLSARQVRQIFPERVRPRRIQLVLVGCSIAHRRPELPLLVEKILAHFARVKHYYGGNFAGFTKVWQPGADTFKKMKAAKTFQDRKLLRNTIIQSLGTSRCDLEAVRYPARPLPELGLTAARNNLRKALDQYARVPLPQAVKDALGQSRRAFEREVLAKIDRAAATQPLDPILAHVIISLASRYFWSQGLVVMAQRALEGKSIQLDDEIADQLFEEQMQLIDRMLKIETARRKLK